MVGKLQKLSKGQEEDVVRILKKKLLAWVLIGFAILTGLTGFSLFGIMKRTEAKMESLVAKQFEEPRIQAVVSKVAETKAEALLLEQIKPEVDSFKAEVASQLSELKSIVADTRQLKSQSDTNAKQIEAILSSVRSTQQEIDKVKGDLFGLQSDLVKLERGIVEIQYFTHKGRNQFPNPYHDRIIKTLNELLVIAIPNAAERAAVVNEIQNYQPKK